MSKEERSAQKGTPAQTDFSFTDAQLREIRRMSAMLEKLRMAEPDKYPSMLPASQELLWDILLLFQDQVFYTAQNLDFVYTIKGNEMFISRKGKSITRSTVNLAFQKALDLQKKGLPVSGPKKLGCFGASYLYPVFIRTGIITSI